MQGFGVIFFEQCHSAIRKEPRIRRGTTGFFYVASRRVAPCRAVPGKIWFGIGTTTSTSRFKKSYWQSRRSKLNLKRMRNTVLYTFTRKNS